MTKTSLLQASSDDPAPPPGGRTAASWRALGASVTVVGGEGMAAYLHPALGQALAAADVITPLAIALILLTAILTGSGQTCERVFRLLRWITNRPEPPGPQSSSTAPAPTASPRSPASSPLNGSDHLTGLPRPAPASATPDSAMTPAPNG